MIELFRQDVREHLGLVVAAVSVGSQLLAETELEQSVGTAAAPAQSFPGVGKGYAPAARSSALTRSRGWRQPARWATVTLAFLAK